ncbi:MAG TPA: sigma-70 family RNA polymerase sigma factor [Flavobacteriaceae bacterium]|nr:sigma-70 family RNA polymerase sigma factor [Flavobacteriaceae bacterium]HPF10040.1 sigma-70 family RNA polymerase sigma factor [Flavobacteriaceae bacterium]HQU21339.1 sigma-70 family RNA polymerase sigma factor [Flavobacteriaceae bacterium]HQU63877.1 sigma-70 family RNA polymerase sigma factor [Flavobacteriaceae bacterium]HRW44363.1 sigma-70 family RNA polymerase sigma factor [Flavobacteriaceae bacterium]
MTLQELIAQCKKQDAKAQEALYREYSGILFGICLKYSPNRVEAEDSLQDAFITIFRRIEQFEGKGSFEGWIKRITVNTVLQKYRKKKLYDIPNEQQIEEAEEEVTAETVPLDFLLKIVQELPDRYRLVFNLYVLDGYSHKEISELLGISDGTSKSNLARARAILKTKVELYHHKDS